MHKNINKIIRITFITNFNYFQLNQVYNELIGIIGIVLQMDEKVRFIYYQKMRKILLGLFAMFGAYGVRAEVVEIHGVLFEKITSANADGTVATVFKAVKEEPLVKNCVNEIAAEGVQIPLKRPKKSLNRLFTFGRKQLGDDMKYYTDPKIFDRYLERNQGKNSFKYATNRQARPHVSNRFSQFIVQPAIQPIYQQPVYQQPIYQQAIERPINQPKYQQPKEPKYQQHREPKYQQHTEPKYQQPKEPKYQQPKEPKYQQHREQKPIEQPKYQQHYEQTPEQPKYQQPIYQQPAIQPPIYKLNPSQSVQDPKRCIYVAESQNYISGVDNEIEGKKNYLRGNKNIIGDGNGNKIEGNSNCVTHGSNNIITGDNSIVLGHGNVVHSF